MKRKARRSNVREESKNGARMGEHVAGEWRGGAAACCGSAVSVRAGQGVEKRMEREARIGVLKAGRGWSERGRPVVPRGELAGAWLPRGLCALARSERGCSGPNCASGPEAERRPGKKQIEFFKLFSLPMTFKCKF